MQKILVVEDDKDLASLVESNLIDAGFIVTVTHDGESGCAEACNRDYDLVILDVKLPKLSGFDACERIKQKKPDQRILFLTSLSDEIDRIVGFERGADDYVTKPFSTREVIARVKAILKRGATNGTSAGAKPLTYKDLSVDMHSRRVFKTGAEVELTALEFDLLSYFVRNKGRAFSRGQLLQQVWGYDAGAYEHTVNSHINRLRAKIEDDPAKPLFIQTVWGVGYRFGD